MSDHLSENMDDWPLNVFDILGVPHSANKSVVRCAYSALIRRFRPETHAQQFQRIRESFEAALVVVESRTPETNRRPIEFRIDLSRLCQDATNKGIDKSAESDHSEYTTRQTREAEKLWEEFSKQPELSQFQALIAVCGKGNSPATALLIGYWMLRLRPEFDLADKPANWLIRGIRECPSDSRFIDLLIHEFRRNPALTSPEFTGTVATAIKNPEFLGVYLYSRWTILGEMRLWKQLAHEINQLRTKFGFDYPAAWFRLMVLGFRLSVFCDDPDGRTLLKSIQREIDELSSLHLKFSAELDHIDLVVAAREDCKFSFDSQSLDDLMSDCLILGRSELRRRLFVFAADWIDTPAVCLNRIERLAADRPEALGMLFNQVEAIQVFGDGIPDFDARLSGEVCKLLDHCVNNGYEYSRYVIVEFCRNECLSGNDLLHLMDAIVAAEPNSKALRAAIHSDQVLMFTCQLIGTFLKECTRKHADQYIFS